MKFWGEYRNCVKFSHTHTGSKPSLDSFQFINSTSTTFWVFLPPFADKEKWDEERSDKGWLIYICYLSHFTRFNSFSVSQDRVFLLYLPPCSPSPSPSTHLSCLPARNYALIFSSCKLPVYFRHECAICCVLIFPCRRVSKHNSWYYYIKCQW